jgi:hypothetical protein
MGNMNKYLLSILLVIPSFVVAGPFLSISTYNDLGAGLTCNNSSYFAEIGWNGKYLVSQVNITGSNLTVQPAVKGNFEFILDLGFSYIFSKKYVDAYTNIVIGTNFPYTLTNDETEFAFTPILGIGFGKNITDHFRLCAEYNIEMEYSYHSYRDDKQNTKITDFTYGQKPRIKALYLF